MVSGSLSVRSFVRRYCHHNNSTTEANSSIIIPVIRHHESVGQVQRWVTFTLFFKIIEVNKGKVCHHNISTPTICITPISIPVIHKYDETQVQR